MLDLGTVDELMAGGSTSAPSASLGAALDDELRDFAGGDLGGRRGHRRAACSRTTSAATVGALLDVTAGRGTEPAELIIRRASLEDVFLGLTGRALRD